MPGRTPLVHDMPLFVEVAKPLSQAPPSVKRPVWATATIVEPAEKVSGSTTVLCWAGQLAPKGSTRIGGPWPFAEAPADTTRTAMAASARVRVSLLGVMFLPPNARGRLAPASRCPFRKDLLANEVERRVTVRTRSIEDDRVVRDVGAGSRCQSARRSLDRLVAVRRRGDAVVRRQRSVRRREQRMRPAGRVERRQHVVAEHPALGGGRG